MISYEPPSGTVAPLPLWPTIATAYRLVVANAAALAKFATLPFILQLIVVDLANLLEPPFDRIAWDAGLEVGWTLLGVAWLRHLLLMQSTKGRFFPILTRRHLRFLGYSLLLAIIGLPVTFFPYLAESLPKDGYWQETVWWTLYLGGLYIALRFSFIYAAVAVDERYSLSLAWQHTRAISQNLFLAVGVATVLPWQIFNHLSPLLLNQLSEQPEAVLLAYSLIWNAALWLLQGTYLAVVVVAFREVTGWVPAPDPEVLERFN